jgi:hypothetical protein
MSVLMSVEERVQRLEKSNRRLKVGMLSLGIAATCIAVLGAAAPTPKAVTAEKFVLLDEAGNERAELSSNSKAAALQLLNVNGSRAAVVTAGSEGNAIFLADTAGQTREAMMVGKDSGARLSIIRNNQQQEMFVITDSPLGTVLAIRDGNGKDRINIGYSPKGAGVAVADANETIRGMVGEQGMATYKKGGQIEWASAGENMTPEERKHVMDIINSTIPNN